MSNARLLGRVRRLIGEGETEKAIEAIEKSDFLAQTPALLRVFTLLKSRWNTLQKDRMRGVRSNEDLNLERNRIHEGLLELFEPAAQTINQPESGKRSWWLLLLLGLVIVSGYALVQYWPVAPQDKPILIQYQVTLPEGTQDKTGVLRVYDDLTADLIVGGEPEMIREVTSATEAMLEFNRKIDGTTLRYAAIQEVGQSYSFLQGYIWNGKARVGEWSASLMSR